MQNEKIHLTRIKRLLERQKKLLLGEKLPLEAEFSSSQEAFQPIKIGEVWGRPWQTGFFRISGRIPESLAGHDYKLLFDCDGEACLLLDGVPHQGFTPKVDWYHKAAKNMVSLASICSPGNEFSLLIDASANDLFGAQKDEYRLRECALVTYDEKLYQKTLDISLLLDLAEALPEKTVRRQRLIFGLNQVCDLWNTDRQKAGDILRGLLAAPANASALSAFSVGHAHLDLAWLWPLKETHRKGARTFANSLRLLEQYPDYLFGASQAQLYQWIKEDQPALYEQVRNSIKSGRWEVQGASWVEFDTNLISSESIIRQFLYGKSFFEREFGSAPRVLWLPDCFGFSGNMPQYLKGCGIDWFITQKLSWNETNAFPHHLFVWEGIDGTRILAHQLPTHDYNFSNNPSAFLETEKRYAQSEVCDAFLNLYGIGDGGGGPTRDHIEYGLRQQNLEGVSKFRFAHSREFFVHLAALDPELLPVAYGELYLEYHRGTYTSQARMKQNNRISERKLGEAEFLAVLCGVRSYPEALRKIWQDTLLLQFHDILPGSSIGQVYQEADQISVANHERLDAFMEESVRTFTGQVAAIEGDSCLVFNPCNEDLDEWHKFPESDQNLIPCDEQGAPLPCFKQGNIVSARLQVPAWGCRQVNFAPALAAPETTLKPSSLLLENRWLKVLVSSTGGIASILEKETGHELLTAESNLLQLWEDEPNDWGAWDINHFYRSTQPQSVRSAKLVPELSISLAGQFSRVVLDLEIGESSLRQTVELRADEPFIRIHHAIDWREKHRMLRSHFYPDLHSGTATYGIQGGVIQRSAKPANAWEEARFEVPAQRFADLSQPDRGCALICNVKFGWRVRNSEMELNLLRSPADVDPDADIHSHSYSYAFYPHPGDYAHSDVFSVANKLASRLVVIPVAKTPLSLPEPMFRLSSDHVCLDTVKPAETGTGIVLRCHEYKGQNGGAKLFCARSHTRVYACDMLENQTGEITLSLAANNPLHLSFRPFETKTLLLREEP